MFMICFLIQILSVKYPVDLEACEDTSHTKRWEVLHKFKENFICTNCTNYKCIQLLILLVQIKLRVGTVFCRCTKNYVQRTLNAI